MILPYFVVHRKIDFKNILLLVALTLIVLKSYDRLFSVIDFLMDKEYDVEGSAYITTAINPFRTAANIFPAAYFLFIHNGKRTAEEEFNLNLLIINAVAMAVASQSAFLGRVGMYTAYYTIIAIPELTGNLTKQNGMVTKVAVILLYGIFWRYGLAHGDQMFYWIWQR